MKSSGNFGKFIGMMFLVFLCMILLLAFMVQTCERVITDHKKETGKTMLQAIGEEARKA